MYEKNIKNIFLKKYVCFQDAQTLIEKKLANLDIEPTIEDVEIPNGEGMYNLYETNDAVK